MTIQQVEDVTVGEHRILRAIVPIIAIQIAFRVLGAGSTVSFWMLFDSVALAIAWRGVKVQLPSNHPNVAVRTWGRPIGLWVATALLSVAVALFGFNNMFTQSRTDTEWLFAVIGYVGTFLITGIGTARAISMRGGSVAVSGGLPAAVEQVTKKTERAAPRTDNRITLEKLAKISNEERRQRKREKRQPTPEELKMWAQRSAGFHKLTALNAYAFERAGLVSKDSQGFELVPVINSGPREERYLDADNNFNPTFIITPNRGQTFTDWTRAKEKLASAWGVPSVKIEPAGPNRIRVVGMVNAFERDGAITWQPVGATVDDVAATPVADYLSRLPVGEAYDSHTPWVQDFREANLTIGGVPGGGKSVYLSCLLAHFAVHPHIEVGMIDLKMGVEAEPWVNRLSAVARTQAEAVQLISWTLGQAKARYERQRQHAVRNGWKGGRDGTPFLGPDEPVRVLVVDEAAELFSGATRDSRALAEQATEELRSLVSLGRAAGYIVILATQKPTTDTLPSAIRDLTVIRVAFRTTTATATQAILGGDAYELSDELTPTSITTSERGQAITANDRGEYHRVQSAYISDDQIDDVVAHTAHYQSIWGWQGQQDEPETATVQQEPAADPEPKAIEDDLPESFFTDEEKPETDEEKPEDE